MVGPRNVPAAELVEGGGDSLGQAPAVDEDDGRAVGANELEQARMDGRPDGAALGQGHRPQGFVVRRSLGFAHLRHVFHRNLDPEVEGLACPGVDDGDRTGLR